MKNVYQKIVDTVPVFFFLWSQDKKETVFISERFYNHRSKDYYVPEVTRHDLRQYIHPESQEAYDRFFANLSEENNYHDEIELRGSDDLPEIQWMKISTFPVMNDGKEIESIAGHIRDITYAKEYHSLLEGQVESLDTVSFMLSHELTSPITNIMGLSEVLKSRAIESGETQDLHLYDSIYNFGGEVITVARGLVSLLELQAQRNKLILTKTQLKPFMQELIENFYLKPRNNSASLLCADIREDAYAMIDTEKFGKAIEELLVFLVKRMEGDSTLSFITPPTASNQTKVCIVGTDVDLPVKAITQVLDRSSRLSMVDVKGGAMRAMLEVVIAKEIIELHQGKLELVEDNSHRGFVIDIPFSESLEGKPVSDEDKANF